MNKLPILPLYAIRSTLSALRYTRYAIRNTRYEIQTQPVVSLPAPSTAEVSNIFQMIICSAGSALFAGAIRAIGCVLFFPIILLFVCGRLPLTASTCDKNCGEIAGRRKRSLRLTRLHSRICRQAVGRMPEVCHNILWYDSYRGKPEPAFGGLSFL